jgi:hypothetical protein
MVEQNQTVEATVRSIRRATRRKYTAEEKVRIVLEGYRSESTIAQSGYARVSSQGRPALLVCHPPARRSCKIGGKKM